MVTITLKVPQILNRRLQVVAKRSGISKSALVRNAVESYLEGGVPEARQSSAYDLLKDSIGKVEGPSDLSSNPSYLSGYGK